MKKSNMNLKDINGVFILKNDECLLSPVEHLCWKVLRI